MTVYIVTSGEYSDYCIEAVFTNEEQAELYCATHRDCEIEEWKADEIKLEGIEIFSCFTVVFTPLLAVGYFSRTFAARPQKTVNPGTSGYEVIFTAKKDVTDEQAVKIARNCVYQYRMEQIENEKAELAKLMGNSNA